MHISNFKYGDRIIRNQPAQTSYGIDNSFQNYYAELISVNEDGIWVRRYSDILDREITTNLLISQGWGEGWVSYIGPRVPKPDMKGGVGPSKSERRIVAAIMIIVSLAVIIGMI